MILAAREPGQRGGGTAVGVQFIVSTVIFRRQPGDEAVDGRASKFSCVVPSSRVPMTVSIIHVFVGCDRDAWRLDPTPSSRSSERPKDRLR